MTRAPHLPIEEALPALLDALGAHGRAVLQAPPGAGKTTRVPLALLEAGLTSGTILVLEPRRLAARAAAERMAEMLGEPLGATVGYRIRGEAKVSRETRIEVVTEGILTRRLQRDPELQGVGAVLFDEFHERSLNTDLGLALCLEVAEALREDLILLPMSATLDAGPVAELIGAPVITSEGRSFPVETRWLETPRPKSRRLEEALADLVTEAAEETSGGILVFLPGEAEIRRTAAKLSGRLAADTMIRPLYGALPFAEQRRAIRPEPQGRKLVLATAIAETSLTIEDVRVVVDAGLARRARFDPGSGMSRLVTERVSRAEAAQRAGRAGRVAPGRAYRLWTRGEEGALPEFPPAEIEVADLAGLALELAVWGAGPEDLPFLTPPPAGPYAEAQALLRMLGALDAEHRVTAHGREMAGTPLHPRLAHMLARAGQGAAPLAALLAERDPLRGAPADLALRLEALRDPKGFAERRPYQVHRPGLSRIQAEAKRLARGAGPDRGLGPAEMAALAYPDRIGLRRKGDAPRYRLSGGSGAALPEEDSLGGARLIVATDLDGDRREARIRQALRIEESALRALFPEAIAWQDICAWSRREGKVIARQEERLGAIALDSRIWRDAPPEALSRAMLEGVSEMGLRLSEKARRFLARIEIGRAGGIDLPASDEAHLLETAEDWLLPFLTGVTSREDWRRFDLLPALEARLDYPARQTLDAQVPGAFTTPLGRSIPIDYGAPDPEISLRLQEMFGQRDHPKVAGKPLRVTLLSPAGRPVQTTMDLPGFWESSYAEVRKEMRGRYPKHPWPEDPREADPTLRAKRRG
ncbi:ATP-dependent helicase HrpB [Roseivivax sp.]